MVSQSSFKAQLLFVQEFQVDNTPLAFQQGVKECEQDGLGYFLSEDALEAYVCEWINELSHFLSYVFSLAKLAIIF